MMKVFSIKTRIVADAFGFAVLLTVAMCIGLLINRFREQKVPLVYVSKAAHVNDTLIQMQNTSDSAAAPSVVVPPRIISLEEFRHYINEKDAIVLDARPEVFYRLGHVAGALSFSREDFYPAYAKMRPRLESHKRQLLLVYCADEYCEDGEIVADALAKLGYRRILVFKGGWAEWDAANLPEEKSE